MNSISQGDYLTIPAFERAFKNLDQQSADILKKSFKEYKEWIIDVKDINKKKAFVEIEVETNDGSTAIYFTFQKMNDEWILQDNISSETKIEFIPFIGLE